MALTVYYCGINTVVVLAAVYAQEVMGFRTNDTIVLVHGGQRDSGAGRVPFWASPTVSARCRRWRITLLIWIGASSFGIFWTESRAGFWFVANLVGHRPGLKPGQWPRAVGPICAPRPRRRVFWLWGLAGKLAAIVGPLSYGLISLPDRGQSPVGHLIYRAVLCGRTHVLATVNESRGRAAGDGGVMVDNELGHINLQTTEAMV